MRTKENFMYSTRNLMPVVAAVLALAFTALSLTGCDNGSDPGDGKTDPTVTWPAGLSAVPGQTLANIPLAAYTNNDTGTFAWDSPAASVGNNLGAQPHTMTFTPTDTAAYNTVKESVNVLVSLMDTVHIKAGTFLSGEAGTRTPHPVTLTKGFYMGKYEVTQEQYEEVMGTNPSSFSSNPTDGETQGKRPVDNVRWYAALAFCNRLSILEGLSPAYRISEETDPDEWGDVPTSSRHENYNSWDAVDIVANSNGYRLPTAAQWEYACRASAGTPTRTHIAAGEKVEDYAWCYSNSGSKTHEVGLKQPNAWGLYDMYGNVTEWCWNRRTNSSSEYYPSEPETDPTGPNSGYNRITCGGGYDGGSGVGFSSASWGSRAAYSSANSQGFRVIRPIQ